MNNEFKGTINHDREKMNKSNNTLIGVALAALAFFLFLIVLGIPFITSFIISFKEYSPARGAMGSPWVGVANFAKMFKMPIIQSIISNTIVISLSTTLVGAVYVFVMTYSLSLIKNKWCKIITTAVIALPIFVPYLSVINMLSKYAKGILLDNSLYVLAPMINEILTVSSIVILFGAFITMKNSSIKAVGFVTLSYVALKLLTFFSPDYEFISLSYNPLVYQNADVLDTFIFRSSIAQMQFSLGGAAFILKLLLQLIPTVIAIVAFMLLPKLLNNSQKKTINEENQSKNIMAIVAVIPLTVVIAILVSGFSGGGSLESGLLFNSLFATFGITVVSCIAFVVIVFTLGYSFSTNNKVIIVLTLLFTLIMNNIVGEYLFVRTTGMVNTIFAVIIANLPYCIFGVVMLYIALSSEKITSLKQYFICSIGPIIALVGVGFGKFFGNISSSQIYINDMRKLPISTLLMNASRQGEGAGLSLVSLVAIIPIVVGLATTIVGLMLYYKTMKVEKEV